MVYLVLGCCKKLPPQKKNKTNKKQTNKKKERELHGERNPPGSR